MINVNVSGDLISGSYGQQPFAVKYTKERYEAMMGIKYRCDDARSFEEVKQCFADFEPLTRVSYKEIVETKCPYIVINEGTKEFFLKNDDVVTSIAMPETLAKRIIESAEKDVDFMPLVKLWIRFLRNPKLRKLDKAGRTKFAELFATYVNADYVNPQRKAKLMESEGLSDEVATALSTVKEVSVTQEGLLCTYKVANEITTKWALDDEGNKIRLDRYKKTIDPDTGLVKTELPDYVENRLFEPPVMGDRGDAYFVEGANGYTEPCHFIKVGCRHRLPSWDMVDLNDNHVCAPGLHVGNITYTRGYQGSGSETFNVFCDPMMIGAIDNNGTGALRVLEYFVHSAWQGTNGSLYHSSTYAAMTDEEWAKMRKEVVEAFASKRDNQNKEMLEINAL